MKSIKDTRPEIETNMIKKAARQIHYYRAIVEEQFDFKALQERNLSDMIWSGMTVKYFVLNRIL